MTDKENLEAEILGRIIAQAEIKGYKSEIENPVPADQQARLIIRFDDLYEFLYKFPYKFAKAFWGESNYYRFDEGSIYLADDNTPMIFSYSNIEANDELHLIENANKHKGNYHWYLRTWEYHLQMMALEEEPIKYLEKFLD